MSPKPASVSRRYWVSQLSTGALALGGSALGAGLLGACSRSDEKATEPAAGGMPVGKTHTWKMVTTWPKNFPGLGTGANHLAEIIGQMSGGRLTIKVYGAGELVPAFGIFDAVSRGTAEMGHGAAYYWKGKHEASQFFAAVPFGLNAHEMNAWLSHGGGQQLWDALYADFGLKPFAAGNTGVQMGGWFNKEINSPEDFRGLKMRIPGLGGEVLSRLGATVVNVPGGEIFQALKTGTIDASEWVGPPATGSWPASWPPRSASASRAPDPGVPRCCGGARERWRATSFLSSCPTQRAIPTRLPWRSATDT
jgi:TRAP-type mannitol/chloroaromatic compound transport system substrate-binding protein